MISCKLLFLPLAGLVLCSALPLRAQESFFGRFSYLLEEAGLDYLAPADAGYREINTAKNSFRPSDYALYSRHEKMEIRFLIEPVRDTENIVNPQMRSVALITHLASNDEEAAIAVHHFPGAPFHADWAKAFFFRPKQVFGEWRHCKMLALYKEGRGMAFVFYFFNEADKMLEDREVMLQFRE